MLKINNPSHWIRWFLAIFVLTSLFIFYKNCFSKEAPLINIAVPPVRPLSFTHTWYGPGLSTTTLEFNQDLIHLQSSIDNPIKLSEGNIHETLDIRKQDYPMLFQQGIADQSRINTYQLTNIKDKYGSSLIAIINEQPSHGDYSPSYGIIVSPFEAKIVFEIPDYFQGKKFPTISNYPGEDFVRLNFEHYGTDSCNSCNLNFLDIYEYNTVKSEFYLANSKHVDEFYKYLIQYKKRDEIGCFFNNQKISFSQIKKIGGDDVECQSSDSYEITNPLKMGKFYSIFNRLERIIRGENISMYE